MNELNNKSVYHEILNAMESAFKNNSIDIIQDILVSPYLSEARENYNQYAKKNDFSSIEEHILVDASAQGLIDIIKFFFNHKDIEQSLVYNSLNYLFYIVCSKGHLEVAEYLMESPKLSEHININYFRGVALTSACENGQLHVVKYLLDSPKLKNNADINYLYEEDNFIDLLEKENSQTKVKGVREVIEYLIFEKKFKEDSRINDFINKPNNLVWLKMFETQELMYELDPSENKTNNKRVKI